MKYRVIKKNGLYYPQYRENLKWYNFGFIAIRYECFYQAEDYIKKEIKSKKITIEKKYRG